MNEEGTLPLKARFVYLWCLLICANVLLAVLPSGSWLYQILSPYDSNRWVHFLAFSVVAAIPVAAWKRRTSVMTSVFTAVLCIAFNFLLPHLYLSHDRPDDAFAELFGVAAGILLGANLRIMHSSSKHATNLGSPLSTPHSPPNETNVSIN
jgi:hypothetical protein